MGAAQQGGGDALALQRLNSGHHHRVQGRVRLQLGPLEEGVPPLPLALRQREHQVPHRVAAGEAEGEGGAAAALLDRELAGGQGVEEGVHHLPPFGREVGAEGPEGGEDEGRLQNARSLVLRGRGGGLCRTLIRPTERSSLRVDLSSGAAVRVSRCGVHVAGGA